MLDDFVIRLRYIIRDFAPHLLGAATVLFFGYGSLCSSDYQELRVADWTAAFNASGTERPSLQQATEQLTTLNCLTKSVLMTLACLFAFYFSDMLTTGRRNADFQLIGKRGSTSQWKRARSWTVLTTLMGAVIGSTTTLVCCGHMTHWTAFKLAMTVDLVLVAYLSWTNRTFDGFNLLLPEIESKRKQKRQEREKRLNQARREQEQAEKRREEAKAIYKRITKKQQEVDDIATQEAELRGGGHDPDLAEEAIAQLRKEKRSLMKEIDILYQTMPEFA